MIELIITDYKGNLCISKDEITSDSNFEISKDDGGRRILTNSINGSKIAYYDLERVLIVSVLNSEGVIEFIGKFEKMVKVYLYDHSEIAITHSNNFNSDRLEIYHLKGGLNSLSLSEPINWR